RARSSHRAVAAARMPLRATSFHFIGFRDSRIWPMSTTLKVGDRFPVERLTPRPDGAAVVYFYPRDLTPGCTLQAKRFNDLYDRFRDLGFEVIGVSMDARESHDEFTRECSLRFPLATDEGGA